MDGFNNDQKLAATITPPVNPSMGSRTLLWRVLKKKTSEAPSAVTNQVNKVAMSADLMGPSPVKNCSISCIIAVDSCNYPVKEVKIFLLKIKQERFKFEPLNGYMLKKWILFVTFAALLAACKSKKARVPGEEPVDPSDFIELFEVGKIPYEIFDSTLTRKENDSFLVSYKVFTRFVPDSILVPAFGKNQKLKIYPLKRVEVEEGHYLFAKVIAGNKRVGYIISFNTENEYTGSMPLLQLDANPLTQQVSGVDRRLSIYKNVYLRGKDGSISEGKEVFIHSAEAGGFMLIMTDALDDRMREIINPIDTFSKKNKYSGDYIKDKTNMVSIRDARPGRFNFYIHINKLEGTCTGELKGEAIYKSANLGIYQQPGDPCSLQFSFTNNSINIKELQACGNRRGVKCSFDGYFPKKKETKPKVTRKK